MDENSPIKFFAKREIDNSRTEGGGNGKLPNWVLKDEELILKSKELDVSLNLIEDALEKRPPEEDFIPTVIKTKINDFAKAKSHRSEVSSLFKVNSINSTIGLIGEDELLIKISSKKDLNKVRKNIKNYKENAHGISCVNKIEKLEPEIILDEDNKRINYKVKLIKYHDYEIDRLVSVLFEKKCKELRLNLNKTIYANDLIVYNLSNITTDAIDVLEEYTALLSIEPMPKYSIDLDFFNINENPILKMPKEGKNYVTVGVLDSGISKIKSLDPWLVGTRQTFYPESLIDPSHGTFVAGVILILANHRGRKFISIATVGLLGSNTPA